MISEAIKEMIAEHVDEHLYFVEAGKKVDYTKLFDKRLLESTSPLEHQYVFKRALDYLIAFEEIDLEKALKCLEINVIGTAALLQAFIPSMREIGTGRIVCMSSLVGQIPFPFESIYSASKFALEGLVQSIKFEVEPFGIRVALVEPAQVSTDFAAKIHYLPDEGSPYRERVKRFIDRDNELIKTAPTPIQAAEKIVKLIHQKNPCRFNQVDFMSTFFLFLNRILPMKIRDMILINHMDIKVPKA